MKKWICLLLILVLSLGLVACNTVGVEGVDKELQGKWVRSEEVQTGDKVYLEFHSGSAERITVTGGVESSVGGSYVIHEDGNIVITYDNGSSQTVMGLATENGMILKDMNSGVYYTKVK